MYLLIVSISMSKFYPLNDRETAFKFTALSNVLCCTLSTGSSISFGPVIKASFLKVCYCKQQNNIC